MSRRHGEPGPESLEPSADPAAAVRELEESIAARRAAIEQSRTAVREAEADADRILAEARRHAETEADEVRRQVLAEAEAEAQDLRQRFGAELDQLTVAAEEGRERWVEAIAAEVLGLPARSVHPARPRPVRPVGQDVGGGR